MELGERELSLRGEPVRFRIERGAITVGGLDLAAEHAAGALSGSLALAAEVAEILNEDCRAGIDPQERLATFELALARSHPEQSGDPALLAVAARSEAVWHVVAESVALHPLTMEWLVENGDPKIQVLLANNSSPLPERVLRRLWGNPDCHRGLIDYQELPQDLFEQALARLPEFPYWVVAGNPRLSDGQYRRILETGSENAVANLLCNPAAARLIMPDRRLELEAAFGEESEILFAESELTTPQTLRRIAETGQAHAALEKLLANPACDEETVLAVLRNPSLELEYLVLEDRFARCLVTSEERARVLVERMEKDPDPSVLRAILSEPGLPQPMRLRLAERFSDSSGLALALALREDLGLEEALELTALFGPRELSEFVSGLDERPDLQLGLCERGSLAVRYQLATCIYIAAATRDRLLCDPSPSVRRAAAGLRLATER